MSARPEVSIEDRMGDTYSAALHLAQAHRDLAGADNAGMGAAQMKWAECWHELLMSLGECDLCDPGTCPGGPEAELRLVALEGSYQEEK